MNNTKNHTRNQRVKPGTPVLPFEEAGVLPIFAVNQVTLHRPGLRPARRLATGNTLAMFAQKYPTSGGSRHTSAGPKTQVYTTPHTATATAALANDAGASVDEETVPEAVEDCNVLRSVSRWPIRMASHRSRRTRASSPRPMCRLAERPSRRGGPSRSRPRWNSSGNRSRRVRR